MRHERKRGNGGESTCHVNVWPGKGKVGLLGFKISARKKKNGQIRLTFVGPRHIEIDKPPQRG